MTQALKNEFNISLNDITYNNLEDCIKDSPNQVIFEIKKLEQIPMGFTSINQLRELTAQTDPQELKNILIRNSQSTHWIALFEHPSFQRRRPQLVPLDSIEPDDEREYFIVSQGQKHGPYEKIQLQAMLEKNEILLTDMVSGDSGESWLKVFQLDGFERRALKDSEELPEMPLDIIEEGNENVLAISASTEAITNLAYLSKNKKSNTAIIALEALQFKIANTVSSGQGLSKVILIASLVGIVYFAFSIKDQLKSPFKSSASSIGEHSDSFTNTQTLTPIEGIGESHSPRSINDQGRFETKVLKPIKANKARAQKSFMQTQNFKNMQNDNQESNNYYDDTTPMELDPVRAQVQKEVYDDQAQEEAYPEHDSLYEEEVTN